MCCNNGMGFGNNNWWWIIILILLFCNCGCGGNTWSNGCCGNSGNWNNGCGCDNDRCC